MSNPTQDPMTFDGPVGGMTLRDYFAAKAMSALVSQAKEPKKFSDQFEMSNVAYSIADRMLAARRLS